MSTTKLYYFPLRGRGEQVRLALVEAEIPYEEGGGNLPALRESGIATFGSLPILEHNGLKLAQGCNIAMYIGTKAGIAGSTEEERADVLQYVLAAEDFRGGIYAVVFGKTTAEEFHTTSVKRWFGCFNGLLEGKDYISSGKFTIADICLYEVISAAVDLTQAPIDEYSNLKAFVERIASRPKIAAYIATRK